MRLLSIFALAFLISFLLHGGLKDSPAPNAGENTEEVVDATDEESEQADEQQAEQQQVEQQEDFSSLIFGQPYPVGHFDFEQEYVFSIIEKEIKNLIIGRNDDSFKSKNHFCAVGYEFPRQAKRRGPARREVVVYWKEGKMLYRWKGGDPKLAEQDFYNAISLKLSRSFPLDPNQGVVGEEEANQGGDKFENYKGRVENTIADCGKHGKPYAIEPFAPPPLGFKKPESGGRPRPPPAMPSAPQPTAPPAPSPAPPPVAPPAPPPAPSPAPSPATPPAPTEPSSPLV